MAEWKTIPEFPNYEVSDEGNVRFIGAYRPFGKHPSIYFPARDLKLQTDSKGYIYIVLARVDGKQKNRRVHRLVAEAFLPNPENKKFVNHKHEDGDRTRNLVSNLEWATKSEDMTHKVRVIGHGAGETNPGAKLTEDLVRQIRKAKGSQSSIADAFGVSRSNIGLIRQRKTWANVI